MERLRVAASPPTATRSGPVLRWVPGLLVAFGLACAAGPFSTTERDGQRVLTHRRLGYSVAAPAWAYAPDWRAVEMPDADLAYRDRRGTAASLATSCPKTRASAATLARHVTIGTPRSGLLEAGPYEQGGALGWTQTFDTVEEGVTIRVKAVTLLAAGCIYDWLLVARGPEAFEAAEPGFDAWIASFEPPPGEPAEPVSDGSVDGEGA